MRIIRDASQAAKQLGKSLLLLDTYYLSVPALVALQEETKYAGREPIGIVVRAKRNATVYEAPVRKSGRGRPPKKGKSVKLLDLWSKSKDARVQTTVILRSEKKFAFRSD